VPTDPEQAGAFVRATEVDALAVSIGNVHCATGGDPEIDLDLLKELRERTGVPLVIHGGSGFPPGLVNECIRLGVAKFNVGTILKKEYYAGIRTRATHELEGAQVQAVVGSRDSSDFTFEAKRRVRERVVELLGLYGAVGRSWNIRSSP
jgi:fructose/tagatose bisphosphate aldolase